MTSAERAAERAHRAAELILEHCEDAGVSKSPSQVRHELASILQSACSQSTTKRILDSLTERRARVLA